MEFSLDLCDLEENGVSVENAKEEVPFLAELDFIPREGYWLAIDPSLGSSGVCEICEGVRHSLNYTVTIDDKSPFREVLARRDLKKFLSENFGKVEYNLIMIEDAFQGVNPDTTRKLYAINTAIDELILDGVIRCKKFLRVNNGVWKRWLFTVDKSNQYSLLKDKLRIQACLELLGIKEDGRGYQDKLDSTGMLIGYFLVGQYEEVAKKKLKVSKSDLCFAYEESEDFITDMVRQERGVDDLSITMYCHGNKSITLEFVKDCIVNSESPTDVFISEEPVVVGYLLKTLGLDIKSRNGGYFAFWLKKSKYNKLIKEVQK